jgi:hypothetical protein
MHYLKTQSLRPPPIFALRLKHAVARTLARRTIALPPRYSQGLLIKYLQTQLLAEDIPPDPHFVAMYIDRFSRLTELSSGGKPILYKKRKTV